MQEKTLNFGESLGILRNRHCKCHTKQLWTCLKKEELMPITCNISKSCGCLVFMIKGQGWERYETSCRRYFVAIQNRCKISSLPVRCCSLCGCRRAKTFVRFWADKNGRHF